ncbi:MAG TPA: hypothetical protein VF777_02765, partial [Phycisphaerales bacterium]
MKTRTLGLLLVGACGAVASVAMADEIDMKVRQGSLKALGDRKDSFLFKQNATQGTFGDRATISVIIYDNTTNTLNSANVAQGTTLATCSYILEDISFAGGPYQPSFTGDRVLTGTTYHYFLGAGTASWDIRHSYYRPSDVNFAGFGGDGNGMIDPNATPYYTLTVTGFDTNLCPNFGGVSNFFALPSEVDVPAGDTGLVLAAAYVEPGTPGTAPITSTNLLQVNQTTSRVSLYFGTNTLATNIDTNPGTAGIQPPAGAQTEAFLAAAGSPASPGYTHIQYGRDTTFSGTFLGQSLVNSGVGTAPNINERRYLSTQRSLGFVVGFAGAVEAPAPIPAQSINDGGGFLPDGTSSLTGTLTPANPFKWYKFNIKNDVNYANVSFLDIDSEGSDAPVSFAIYTPNSAVFDFGESRGSGPDTPPSNDENNAFQISYGVARRPGVNNGVQYSGQEGVLPAGEYYLIVAPAGSGFGDGWATN